MRYIIVLIAVVILFAQCKPDIEMQPTGSFDTLGVTWMTIERNNITYYFQGTGVKGASIYSDIHEEAYVELESIFNPVLPKKLRYFVWTDWEQARTLFNTPDWSGGFALSKECVCHVRADISRGHELVHVFTFWAEGILPSSYSRFINEGVAVAFDLEDYSRPERAVEALKEFKLNSITELWDDPQDQMPPDLIYPVGGAFMEYMYQLSSRDEYFALLRNQTIQDAEFIYGKERLAGLIKDFDSKLGL